MLIIFKNLNIENQVYILIKLKCFKRLLLPVIKDKNKKNTYFFKKCIDIVFKIVYIVIIKMITDDKINNFYTL